MLKTKKEQKQKSTRTPELCLIVDLNARQKHYKAEKLYSTANESTARAAAIMQ